MDKYTKAKTRYQSIKGRNLIITSKEDFLAFYGEDDKNRECSYCKITENEISKLINSCSIKTKRLSTRGRSMEVDRINPHLGYTKDNINLSCYWCNNAKTDEFLEDEFKNIAKEIRKVWKGRLKNSDISHGISENEKLLTDGDSVNNIFFAFPYGMHSAKTIEKKWWEDLEKLMDAISTERPEVQINLVYKNNEEVFKEVKKHKKYKFVESPYLEDVWLRDFMPLAISGNKAVKAIYSPTYFNEKDKESLRKYSYGSHRAGLNIAQGCNIECYSLSKGPAYWHEKEVSESDEILPIVLDGGNFIHNGEIGFISARVLVENFDKGFDECNSNAITQDHKNKKILEIIKIIEEKTKLKIYILPTEKENVNKPEYSGHLDGTIRFIDKNNLFIDEDYYTTHKIFLDQVFKKYTIKHCCIKQTLSDIKNDSMSIKGIILNYLRIGDTLFVPSWNDKILKEELEKFIKICDTYCLKCKEVEEPKTISSQGGIFNCISWTTNIN